MIGGEGAFSCEFSSRKQISIHKIYFWDNLEYIRSVDNVCEAR